MDLWCRWRGSNPHGIATTGFWVQHVCQFHHTGVWENIYPLYAKIARLSRGFTRIQPVFHRTIHRNANEQDLRGFAYRLDCRSQPAKCRAQSCLCDVSKCCSIDFVSDGVSRCRCSWIAPFIMAGWKCTASNLAASQNTGRCWKSWIDFYYNTPRFCQAKNGLFCKKTIRLPKNAFGGARCGGMKKARLIRCLFIRITVLMWDSRWRGSNPYP